MEEILETRQHNSLEDKWKWNVWVFPLSFSSFFLSQTLFQGSEKEKIPSAKQKTSLVLAKTLWVTAAGGPSSSGCARGAEHREGSSSCIHVCCMIRVLWAYCHDLSMIFQEILFRWLICLCYMEYRYEKQRVLSLAILFSDHDIF